MVLAFFTVEKRCISEEQFHKEFPEENGMFDPSSQSTHCASTFDGSVNYCICATDMCNVLSLVDQADQGRYAVTVQIRHVGLMV